MRSKRGSWMLRLARAAPALALAAACLADGVAAAPRALLVGIDRYQNIPPEWQLSSAAGDARRMQQFLSEQGLFKPLETLVLYDDQATRANILKSFSEWLEAGTEPDDPVLFYFSGHGAQVRDQDGDERRAGQTDGRDEALLATDAGAREDPSVGVITDDELSALLARLADRRVMVIVDSCHSGSVTQSAGIEVPTAAAISVKVRTTRLPEAQTRAMELVEINAAKREGGLIDSGGGRRIVWTAAAPYQFCWEDEEGGVFTTYFIRGIAEGEADFNANGRTTTSELLDYVRDRSDAWCRGSEVCRGQNLGLTPGVAGSETDMLGDALQLVARDAPPPLLLMAPPADRPDRPAEAQTEPKGGIDPSDVLGHDNSAGLRIEILPGSSLRIGDEIRFRIVAEQAGWFVILNQDPDGGLYQLYPNKHAGAHENRVEAGVPIVFPDDYYGFRVRAAPPAGPGKVIALITQDELSLSSLTQAHLDLAPIADAPGYLGRLAQRLRQTLVADGVNRAARWSTAYRDYDIAP